MVLKTSNCRRKEKIPPVRSECKTIMETCLRPDGRRTQTAGCPTVTRQERALSGLRRASSTPQKAGLSPMATRSTAPKTLRPRTSHRTPGGNPCCTSKGTTPTPLMEWKCQPLTMPQHCDDPNSKTRLSSTCRSAIRKLGLQSSRTSARSSSMSPSLIAPQTCNEVTRPIKSSTARTTQSFSRSTNQLLS